MGSLQAAASPDMEDLKAAVKEAERLLDLAEREVASRKVALKVLQKKLQDELIGSVGGLKVPSKSAETTKPAEPVDEETRRARVRRRWRILAMKVRFGLGASAMAVKARNLKDAASFIDKETEEASKEDQMDLEGKCARIKKDKRHFRRGGVRVGCSQGRDAF